MMLQTKTRNKYLTMSEVKDYLNISQSAAYELAHRKDFPVFRIGGCIRVPETEFMAWIDMQTCIPAQLRSFMGRGA